ncbi:transcriptional regulator with XRE-family HTH domain [Peribacillus deserti]|uniref:Transcriptional regulator with XRE-family HTH domain n=1 Tax=Peribacillus deserti TaxID=673318 RepID=A0ABS2QCK9_9BACI|nr:helix-turn-helix domain-containing protein [Peribacillus deserti]MBM7690765.1 transcriptional regulator with XRE-family HTH domain [Peribacillus deserti]
MNTKHDFSHIGMIIRDLREQLNIGQKELCEGICTQSQISKIENGEAYPKATTLYLLAMRLGVEVNQIFEMTANHRMDYSFEVISMIRELVRKKDYTSLLEMILVEEKNPNITNHVNHKQFLIWHKGICMYYVKNDKEGALKLLNDALKMTSAHDKFYNQREISILNSIGVIHSESGDHERAVDIYNKALHFIKQNSFQDYSVKTKVRLYYNLAKAQTRLEHNDESIHIAKEGIKICLENESLYLLGELYYHAGYNYYLIKDEENYSEYFNYALTIFKLTNKPNYIKHIEELLIKTE